MSEKVKFIVEVDKSDAANFLDSVPYGFDATLTEYKPEMSAAEFVQKLNNMDGFNLTHALILLNQRKGLDELSKLIARAEGE